MTESCAIEPLHIAIEEDIIKNQKPLLDFFIHINDLTCISQAYSREKTIISHKAEYNNPAYFMNRLTESITKGPFEKCQDIPDGLLTSFVKSA